jgi:hypothetical protein
VETSSPKILNYAVISKQLSKVNNCPKGEISPNPVTLIYFKKKTLFPAKIVFRRKCKVSRKKKKFSKVQNRRDSNTRPSRATAPLGAFRLRTRQSPQGRRFNSNFNPESDLDLEGRSDEPVNPSPLKKSSKAINFRASSKQSVAWKSN